MWEHNQTNLRTYLDNGESIMAQIRWYLGYKYKVKPKDLIEKVTRRIQEHNLSQHIPLLRLEKGATSRKPFYFFLAIESTKKGEIPTEVDNSNLLKLPFFKIPAAPGNPSFTFEEIKPMVGAAHDVYDYIKLIPYEPLQEFTYDNPFDFIESSTINHSSPDIEALSHRYEELLYWLSALGCGRWESFKKACEAMNLEEPKRILRRLKLLGHIESSSDGSRWSIAPTALVKVDSQSDFQEFILCGQRNINLLEKFKQQAIVNFINQPRGNAPPCVRIRIDNYNTILDLVAQVNSNFSITNAHEVSLQLANILPNVVTWKQSLRHLQGIVPSLYEWEYFNGNNFVSCLLPKETGMYRMCNKEISTRPLYTLFYDQESDKWLQGDWYGLRFLALQHGGQQCIVRYDIETKCLAIPVSQRLPEIYERALVLASGRLPIYKESWLIYENIRLELLQKIGDKINLV
ncbi:MAG: hypothetical protein AAFW70_02620 [Cyanobacteria bacterium J06635_10]